MRTKLLPILGLAALTTVFAVGAAGAKIVEFDATIDGAQETPPNGSTAVGSGTFTMDTDANTLSYSIFLTVLPPSGEVAAHIHGFAAPGTPAGILFPLPAGNPKNGVAAYAEGQEADLIAGLSYVNIHSAAFPGGEIRGQIVAESQDIGVVPTKLIALNNLATAGKAKVVFVSKDPGVDKGTGTDPEEINVQMDLFYEPGSVGGGFVIPSGGATWLANSATVAKFVNQNPPGFTTYTKVFVLKPGSLVKLIAKDGLGDGAPFDPLAFGPPSGSVFVSVRVINEGFLTRLCAELPTCVHTSIAGGTGAKLVCKGGVAEPSCSYSP